MRQREGTHILKSQSPTSVRLSHHVLTFQNFHEASRCMNPRENKHTATAQVEIAKTPRSCTPVCVCVRACVRMCVVCVCACVCVCV